MECEIKKILSTTWIPDECVRAFEGIFEITYPKEGSEDFSYEKVMNMVEHFDALFVLKDFMCGRKMIDAGVNLKAIASHGIGYSNIDVDYATEREIFVLNTPIGFCEATAEFSISLIMSSIRGIAWYDKEFNNAKSAIVDSMNAKNTFLYGKTLGIIGFGGIGKAVARKALGFGMKIIYYDIVRSSIDDEEKLFAEFVSFEELLKNSDIVTCHIPTQEHGKYLMNIEAFKKMKDTAYFINATRGHIVSEFDFLEALRKKEIRAAAIDIHEFESKTSEDIASLENVVITPNVATVAYESRVNMCLEILHSMQVLSTGKFPHNIVNNNLCKMLLNPELKENALNTDNTEEQAVDTEIVITEDVEHELDVVISDEHHESVHTSASINEISEMSETFEASEMPEPSQSGSPMSDDDIQALVDNMNSGASIDTPTAEPKDDINLEIDVSLKNTEELDIQSLVDNVSKEAIIDRTPMKTSEDIDLEVEAVLADEPSVEESEASKNTEN